MSGSAISYPVKFYDLETGETEFFENENELVSTLEWFDSIGGDENAILEDARGRKILAKIEELKLLKAVVIEGE